MVDPSFLEKENPEFVDRCCGSKPIVPPITGVIQDHVYTAQQILEADDQLALSLRKGKILIVGGGSVGLETALYLAKKLKLTEVSNRFLMDFAESGIRKGMQCSSDITVVEMAGKIGSDLGGLRHIMLKELERYGIDTITNTRVEEILKEEAVIKTGEETTFLKADTVILAVGYRSQGKSLIDWLEESGKYPYCVIGDAAKVGNIGKALQEAYEIAR